MQILSGCDTVPKKDYTGNVTVLKMFQLNLLGISRSIGFKNR